MLRWGILGTSFISETMAQSIENDEGSVIYAVAGRRMESAEQFCQKFSATKLYDNYSSLINDPDVDVVYIGLPNHLHHTYTIEAAEAGKHILCEKSLSIDPEKTREIAEAVNKSSGLFIEGLMYLHHPFTAKLVELIESGVIGEIKSITGQYCADIARFVNPESKGAIFNLGCYPVSLMHLVFQTTFGEDIWNNYKLSAFGSVSPKDGNICDTSLNIQLSNGVTARIHTSETYGDIFSDFSIIGEKGILRYQSNPWLPESSDNVIELKLFEQQPEPVEVTAESDAFFYQVKNIREAIKQEKQHYPRPLPRIQDSEEIMMILSKWEQASHAA